MASVCTKLIEESSKNAIDPRQKRFGSKDFFSRDKVTSGSLLQINSALNSFRYIGLFEHGFESELITKMVAPCHSTALFKGQLISKCPYEKSVSSKIPTKMFLDFCPEIFCSFLGASLKHFGLPVDLVNNIIN